MAKFILGISGKARHGKDTAAEALIHRLGFGAMHFAAPLKDACAALFGLTKAQLYGADKEKPDAFWGRSPREILQHFGSAMRNSMGEDIFIKALEQRLHKWESPVVIADVRFPNEALAVRRWGGYLVRVVRVGHPGLEGEAGQHESETALDHWTDWDEVITAGDGELHWLRDRITNFAFDNLHTDRSSAAE